ncbi:MAG: hypothetical protein CFE40_06850 [Burkholderiales bacterium PBB1]|nr:MAG: hypothetical protein CFE40_06850 [Burkholderiales bacterium PBB1]
MRLFALALIALTLSPLAQAAASDDKKRIAEARAKADADLAAEEAECRTRFAVTPCLLDAREKHRAIVEPLRRDELTVDERERRQRAADRLGHLSRKAEAARVAASAADATAASAPDVSDVTTGKPLLPIRPRLRSGSASEPIAGVDAASAPPAQTRRAHKPKRLTPAPDPQAAQRAEDRVRQAEERRARVLARNAERNAKKPPAAPLPVPAGAAPAAASGASR